MDLWKLSCVDLYCCSYLVSNLPLRYLSCNCNNSIILLIDHNNWALANQTLSCLLIWGTFYTKEHEIPLYFCLYFKPKVFYWIWDTPWGHSQLLFLHCGREGLFLIVDSADQIIHLGGQCQQYSINHQLHFNTLWDNVETMLWGAYLFRLIIVEDKRFLTGKFVA